MNLTKQQIDAVNARGNILVSAAAGSGKTAVLTRRVIDRVLNSDNPIDIDKLLIVTFTSAAATEMRKRIADALQNVIDEDAENIRAAKQKMLLESASISTIDSFCINLVKENFNQLGIKPDFTTSTEDQLAIINEAAMNETISKYYVTEDAEFFSLIDFLGDDGNDTNLRKTVKKVYDFTRSLPFPDRWLDTILRYYECFSIDNSAWCELYINECTNLANATIKSINHTLQEAIDVSNIGTCLKAIFYCKDKFEMLIDRLDNNDYEEALNICSSFKSPQMRIGKEDDKEYADYLKQKRDVYKSVIGSIKEYILNTSKENTDKVAICAPHIAKLIEIVKNYSANLLDIKKEQNQYDFADIESFTLKLLVDDCEGELKQTALAQSICTRYSDVLVDEYQDTNDLQNAIFNAVSDNGKNLFTVGDVKQCIYNFRKANPINFLNKKNSYPLYDGTNDPCKIILSGNFRSNAKICNFVNYIFEKLMNIDIAGMDYIDEDRLIPLGNFSEEDTASVELNIIDSSDSDKDDSELQAEYIAEYINNSVGVEMISDNGEMRPVKYSDFMIMLRSGKSKIRKYAEIFNRAGIPVSAYIESEYFKLPEICIILNLLKVINNPLKDISMLGVALSPLYAVSPNEVANVRLNSKNVPLYSAFLAAAKSNEKISNMLEKIQKYRRWAASMSVSSLISRIYDDTLLTHIMMSSDDGSVKKANLLYFIEYAKGFEKNNFGGLGAFVSYIDHVLASNGDITRKYTVGNNDAVQIMTVHQSKGLQAPICFVVNCSADFYIRDASENVVMHQKYGIGMNIFNSDKRTKCTTLPREAVATAIKKDIISEEARLLYVAMTRAQNRLIFLSVNKNIEKKLSSASQFEEGAWLMLRSCKSYFDWLISIALPNINVQRLYYTGYASSFGCNADFSVNIIDANDILTDYKSDSEIKNKEHLNLREMNDRILYKYPYENILNINSKYSASGLAENSNIQKYYCTKRPAFMNDGSVSASQRGTIMHRFMEVCSFANAETDVENEIKKLVDQKVFTQKEADCIDRDKIRIFLSSDVYAMIKTADTVLREARFIYEMPIYEIDNSIQSDEKVTVQGVADCVIVKDGKITVIDYKTDRVNNEDELIERYNAQLKLYAKAMNNTFKLPINDCVIYSFALGRGVSIGFSI